MTAVRSSSGTPRFVAPGSRKGGHATTIMPCFSRSHAMKRVFTAAEYKIGP